MTHSIRAPATGLAWLLLLALPVAAQQPRSTAPLPPLGTHFDAALDGLPFDNFGDYASPEGNCFGMSLLAIDNYLRRMERRARGEPDPAPQPIARRPQDGHIQAQILASLAQLEAERRDEEQQDTENPRRPLSDPSQIRAGLERIMRSGTPEVMGLYARDGSGHAVVLHGWDGSNLLIYDPNYPGELIRWPWSPTRGLGRHPKRNDGSFYRQLTQAATTPLSQLDAAKELAAIRAACAAGADRCLARFPTAQARVEEENGRRVVTGRVQPRPDPRRGDASEWRKVIARPARAWVIHDGRPVAAGRLDGQGNFRVELPANVPADAPLEVVVVTRDDGGLAGFGRVAPAPGHDRPASPGFTGALDSLR